MTSQCRGYDVTRRSYDTLDPSGRALFVVGTDDADEVPWVVVGNAPGGAGRVERGDDCLRLVSERRGLRVTVEIRPAGPGDPAEVWDVTVENPTDRSRSIKVVPYLEWVLNKAEADRGHTQYNRLFAEMEYAKGLHAVLAWDNHSKAMGVLAADLEPEGFLTSRVDFIGRGRSLWDPRALETLAFSDHQDTDAHPTFDPIGSLLLEVNVPANASTKLRLLIGMAKDKAQAVDLIARHLAIPGAKDHPTDRRRKAVHAIRHGEIPPGTPQPYSEFSDDGRALRVLTPFTPRPYDHAMSNALGHFVSVTNRGFQTTSSGNSQQNRITPDWPDTVTREVPPEAFYLFDPESKEWFSPTYQPLNDAGASYESEFGVDGTATFHMKKGEIETELTVFVPPDEPCGVYLLTVRNRGDRPRTLRAAYYAQIVLAAQPEYAGPLDIRAIRNDQLIPEEFEWRGARVPRNPLPTGFTYEHPRNTYPERTGLRRDLAVHVEAAATSRGCNSSAWGVTWPGPPAFVETGGPAEDPERRSAYCGLPRQPWRFRPGARASVVVDSRPGRRPRPGPTGAREISRLDGPGQDPPGQITDSDPATIRHGPPPSPRWRIDPSLVDIDSWPPSRSRQPIPPSTAISTGSNIRHLPSESGPDGDSTRPAVRSASATSCRIRST